MKKDFDWSEYWRKCPSFIIKGGTWYSSRVLLKLSKGLNIKTCLELGGGPGLLAKIVAQKLGYELTLVENDPEAYKLFKKFSNFGDYIFKDFFRYKPKEEFDLVFSYGVIEHFSDKSKRIKAIKNHKRLSKKFVAIFVPKDSFLIKRFFHYPEEKGFEKFYRKEEFKNELKAAGLNTIKFAQNLHAIGFLCRA